MDKPIMYIDYSTKNVIHSPYFYSHTHQLKVEGDLKICADLEHAMVRVEHG